ncbi:MAG: hypothetical protein QHH75_13690 [Bacillota bacterium]|nr:hypothetical protein [Bacillota bacterium]
MNELQKGVVLEVEGNYVYLLAAGGHFYRMRWKGTLPEVGEEVCVRLPSRLVPFVSLARGALVACLALFLLVCSTAFGYRNAPRVAACVSLDINPSVEVMLNTRNRVVQATPLNQAGAAVLKRVRLLGQSGEQAVRIFTAEAAREGFLREGRANVVLITVTPFRTKVKPGLEGKLAQEVNNVLRQGRLQGEVKGIETTPRIRDKAYELGLSPGKYAVLVESLNSGLKVTPKALREESIPDILEQAGGNVSSILNSLSGNKLLEEKVNRLETQARQQTTVQTGQGPLNGLLDAVLGPGLLSGTKNSHQPLNSLTETVDKLTSTLIGPPVETTADSKLQERGVELPPEGTLRPVEDKLIKPLAENVLEPLGGLLGTLLGSKESDN